jgi:UDP-glucose 4,6-dehydratase
MVILLGSTGYIGQEFEKQLEEKGVETLCLSRADYNYYDLHTLREILTTKEADFLINCAGYTGKPNVDACEDHQEEASRANVMLPRIIAKACAMTGTPWAHISSGCIYAGTKGAKGFTENDVSNFSFDHPPCSFYSGTKVQGEEAIKKEGGDYYIWRLRIPFDENDSPRNYLTKLMKYPLLLDANNSISHKSDFVKYCLALWEKEADFGIYNVVNTGYVTTRQVTDKINKILGINKQFKFFESEKDMYDLGAARTPRSNCVLDNTKLIAALRPMRVRTASSALDFALRQWKNTEQDKDKNGIDKSFWT